MTLLEFCKKYGIPREEMRDLDKMLRENQSIAVSTSLDGSLIISREVETRCLSVWRRHKNTRDKMQQHLSFLEEEDRRVVESAQSIPVTSTQSIDGYRIVRYCGYVSGDEIIELNDSWFGRGDFDKNTVSERIKKTRSAAIEELKYAAAKLGCDAVVGLDFDYISIDAQFPGISGRAVNRSFVMLTANGTAVSIEPL